MVPLHRRSAGPSNEPAPRLAWLRAEFAALYPEVPPGVWITAVSAAWIILGGVYGRTRPWPGPGPRLLPDEHFVFREGDRRPQGWSGPPSRMDDP